MVIDEETMLNNGLTQETNSDLVTVTCFDRQTIRLFFIGQSCIHALQLQYDQQQILW